MRWDGARVRLSWQQRAGSWPVQMFISGPYDRVTLPGLRDFADVLNGRSKDGGLFWVTWVGPA